MTTMKTDPDDLSVEYVHEPDAGGWYAKHPEHGETEIYESEIETRLAVLYGHWEDDGD